MSSALVGCWRWLFFVCRLAATETDVGTVEKELQRHSQSKSTGGQAPVSSDPGILVHAIAASIRMPISIPKA